MFARVTTYKVKPGSEEALLEKVEGVRRRLADLDGLLSSHSLWKEDGRGLVVGIWESEAAMQNGAAKVRASWESLAEHLDGALEIETYENVEVMKG